MTDRRRFSRRRLLRTTGAAAAAAALSGLSGCGIKGSLITEGSCQSTDLSASEKQVVFSNWPQYIDVSEDEKSRPTLDRFAKETGIQVKYTEDVNDNSPFFSKIRNQLAACRSCGRDIFVFTDWMAARVIRYRWLQELDHDKMPNVKGQLIPSLEAPGWDPDRKYSVPWQSGLTGLAYNAKLTKEIRSLNDLLTRSDLKGRVTMLAGMQDSMQMVLMSLGKNPIEVSQDDFATGIERLEKAVASGQIRRFTGNDYTQDLANGDVAACMAWSGDVIQLQFENPDIKFVVPEEGLGIWSDNSMIPNKASHKANAEMLLNYYYEPEIAAEVAAWVNYICPVKGAREAMEKIDPELVDNPLIFPDEALLKKAVGLMNLTETQERNFEIQFQQVIGA